VTRSPRPLLAAALALAALAGPAAADPRPPLRDELPPDHDAAEETASDFWERAIRPHGDAHDAAVKRAELLLRAAGDGKGAARKEAEGLLREAIALEPRSAIAHWLLGELYTDAARWPDCAASLKAVFAIDPAFRAPGPAAARNAPPSLDERLGDCLARSGEFDDAVDHYRRIPAGGSAYPDILRKLGDAHMATGRLRDAIAAYEGAIAANPNRNSAPYFAAAVAYDRDEQTARMRERMDEALRRDRGLAAFSGAEFMRPEEEDYYRALAHVTLGERARAISHLRRYLARAGASPWVRRASEHLAAQRQLGFASDDIRVTGAATLDRRRVAQLVLAHADDLHECVQGVPTLLLDVRITVVAPAPKPPRNGGTIAAVDAAAQPAQPQPGVAVVKELTDGIDATAAERAAACTSGVARRIKLPKPIGAPGTSATIAFSVVAP
jgi:tetratricopeptide (TPR) repeat protein